MQESKTTFSTRELVAWLSQEKLWGDVHRRPYFKGIKAQLEAAQFMAEAIKDLCDAEDEYNCTYVDEARTRWLEAGGQ